ncbi:MAG: hypothetical protein HY012_01490, partial [Acidobacteria bacterium]|nr:hypothetical protein [Acidobacteriota bacterium]
DSLPLEREGPARAEVGLISWGATQGAVREAVQRFRQIGADVAALYPKLLWPLPVKALETFASSVKKVVVVEANKQGQLASMIRADTRIETHGIQTYSGVPISPWDIFGKEFIVRRNGEVYFNGAQSSDGVQDGSQGDVVSRVR